MNSGPRIVLPDPRTPIGFVRGRPVYPIAGASPEGDDNVTVSFTQDELSRRLTREKDQGGRAALRKLAESLGFPDATALTSFVTAQRAPVPPPTPGTGTDVQRAAEQALTAREQALATRESAAAAAERSAALRLVLAGLGAGGDDLADAAVLLDRDLDKDADDTAITEAAQALKARRPLLFGPEIPPAPGGAPAGSPPTGGQQTSSRDGAAGLEMARRRGYVTN